MKFQNLLFLSTAAVSTVSASDWTQTYNPSGAVNDVVLKCGSDKPGQYPRNGCLTGLLQDGIVAISDAIAGGQETGIINKGAADASFVFHYKKAPGKFQKIDKDAAHGTARAIIADDEQHPRQGCVGVNYKGDKKFEFSFSLNGGGVTFNHDLPPCSG
ncbi:hypothetical protein TRICI_005978 [Trichomonascus ciferrii]|uniref:Cell wall protein YJL171C/Tos1 C-terminal domain-containing protein n=1 Tax=Trichomonascus ciferrii TaxID=44093 RepID=A0A642UML2_9ASCO|nr:hypothetical protein TRICI_005978 [Trichomonascus ciferrii]